MELDHSWGVVEFSNWWLERKIIRPPFLESIFYTDIAASVVLFRDGPFQVELYIAKPDTEAPYHTHPGVDSILMYLTGDMSFGMNGVNKDATEWQKPHAEHPDLHMLFGVAVPVLDSAQHNLVTKGQGGAFFSFEKWKDKPPTSVTANWDGEPTGEIHQKVIEQHAA